MPAKPTALVLICLALGVANPAVADALDDAAVQAEPQYYLMSLPEAPAAEIAEAVLGEALGLPFRVDPAVDATMAFQVDGLHSPRSLAREFGYRLWNAEVALIDRPSSGLWLIPKSKLEAAIADGAVLVAPPVGVAARPVSVAKPMPKESSAPPSVAAPASTNWSWLAWLAAGWIGGGASALAWIKRRRPGVRAVGLLPSPQPIESPAVEEAHGHDDLVIPTFHR